MFTFPRAAMVAALAIGSAAVTTSVADAASGPQLLTGAEFSMQNYFNNGGELIPFFQQIDDEVGTGQEVDGDFIYDMDFKAASILMTWNTSPEYDIYEPYVGALAGITQEQAAAAPLADEYHIDFDIDISQLRFSVDPSSNLGAEVRVEGDHKLIIAIPGGTTIGDGIGAKIKVRPPVRNIRNLDYSLQNYFNSAGDLIPFFDQMNGTVGSATEIEDEYIYDINLVNRTIAMDWNTSPEFDMFEPYVGALAGITQEEAAAAPLADEYHFTFSEKVSHFTPTVAPASEIQPNLRFEDDYTLVIAIPGGTTIGDGIGLRVSLD